MKIFSILGTDTEIGKTHTTVAILNYLNKNNFHAYGLKPIVAGLTEINGQLINEDTYKIAAANSSPLPYNIISPLQLKLAIAPHIAANYQQLELNVKAVIQNIQNSINIIAQDANHILIEGIGGIMVPLNKTASYLDILQELPHPVILVVGMKLGCLNHALLSYNTLLANNITVAGWVANCITPEMPYFMENLEYLKNYFKSPLLAIIPHNAKMVITTQFMEILLCN
jgi:dethiobiotin synthetase